MFFKQYFLVVTYGGDLLGAFLGSIGGLLGDFSAFLGDGYELI